MAPQGYVQRFTGGIQVRRAIYLREREWAVLIDPTLVDLRARARLESLMQHYCDHGPIDMNEKMFKFLEHFKAERRQVRLEEFKAGAVRLFGFGALHAKTASFFVTGMDAAKKQAKADRTLLDSAGKEAIRLSQIV
ncbi:hypothetical protein [Sphingomonas sp. UNC305MFCol5.2]|uniref:hypothetical protein n=1 Tax=Sphingomonas sp. UNC305MFCol5.2 TaxID=1449076 RepID=UPI0012DBD06C|nr:hypothetical protein [Sphingomonas sp. UNC305MFCol5.2]